jgi:aminopeptidase N
MARLPRERLPTYPMQPRYTRLPLRLWAGVSLCAIVSAVPSTTLPACQGVELTAQIAVVQKKVDLREAYDVLAYDVALELEERTPSWKGLVQIVLEVGDKDLGVLQVDAGSGLTIASCTWGAKSSTEKLPAQPSSHGFQHKEGLLSVQFSSAVKAGTTGTLQIEFSGTTTRSKGRRPAVYWKTSKDGSGRMDCSLQYSGAHNVFPCKSSFFHPEDVPNQSSLALTVPNHWVAIGPGSQVALEPTSDERHTYRFKLDQPTPTWALGFAAGPYEVRSFPWKGMGKEMTVELYRLKEHKEAFDELVQLVPSLLDHHERIFGAYPFSENPLAVVETLAMSSANATWFGVGTGALDLGKGQGETKATGSKVARILSHELGHAWWGHGLFVGSWRDNWLHESFASYGALLFVGEQKGDAAMSEAFQRIAGDVSFKHRLALCERASACSATSINSALWCKGPWVLRTLRSQVNNDPQWFAAIADFQKRHRSQTVATDDFSTVLGEHTGATWDRFFEEWFESSGLPCIVGTVRVDNNRLLVDLENRKDRILTRIPGKPDRNFHLSLKLQWQEGSLQRERKLQLEPGVNSWRIDCETEPTGVKLVGLEAILGPHEVKVLPLADSELPPR